MLQFPEQIDRLVLLAQVAEVRHRVISHNIANVNTPGYQRLDVRFDEELLEAKRRERRKELEPSIVQEPGTAKRLDGNTVDIDEEIGQLNRNAMLFQVYNQMLMKHVDTMHRAMGSR